MGWNVITPTLTTPTNAAAGQRVFRTVWPWSPRLCRKMTYCVSPSAIPTAATPKPQWNPSRVCSRPVTVGADDAGRGGLGHFQAAIGERVIEVLPEDGEHPVVREPLPAFDTEQVGQADRMAEHGATDRTAQTPAKAQCKTLQ